MISITCQVCGHSDKQSSRFCPSCGNRLLYENEENTDVFEIVESLPHEYDRAQFPQDCGLLVVESGPKAGARYGLEAEIVTIGRHGEAEVDGAHHHAGRIHEWLAPASIGGMTGRGRDEGGGELAYHREHGRIALWVVHLLHVPHHEEDEGLQ